MSVSVLVERRGRRGDNDPAYCVECDLCGGVSPPQQSGLRGITSLKCNSGVPPSHADNVDYEGLSEHVLFWSGLLVGGAGNQLAVYMTSLLFLMAQHRTILNTIPMI